MAKFPEADARLFKNIFVCKDCKHRMRTSQMKVLQGRVSCRSCKSRALRVVRKK